MNGSELVMGIASLIPSGICAAVAGYMAIYSIHGWGWFLFLSVVLFPSIRTGKSAELHAQKELEESRKDVS